ncbi:hypothetical protein FQA39_LY16830 [Lamprigera yunnana]|nr:hypothetical protein FQA39_LY16830 [Lamprigera yunnana]
MQKYTAVYTSTDEIANLKIRIRIKEVGGELNEERTFCWQEQNVGKLHKSVLFNCNDEDEFGLKVMHLMANFTGLKSFMLCTIKYADADKYFTVHPDFTQLDPYRVELEGEHKIVYEYYIDDVSDAMPLQIQMKEKDILSKISNYQFKLRREKVGTEFKTCSKDKLCIYLFGEILTAKDFEYHNVYVQYLIDLPNNWTCKDPASLTGCTQSSRSSGRDLFFGFPFEVELESCLREALEGEAKVPYIYFEVVSKDTWDRFRTEGVAYTALPILEPGINTYNLRCLRMCPEGLRGSLRRFFIGDFSNCVDTNLVSYPVSADVVNKYGTVAVPSGQMSVRFNVMQQSRVFAKDPTKKRTKFILDKLNTSGLIRSVEQVVAAFKIAKKKMMEAKKNL